MKFASQISLLCLTAALPGLPLCAEEPPAPKPARELFTTSAPVTDPGVLLLNTGIQESDFKDGSQVRHFPTQVDLGLSPWVDLRASWFGPTTVKDPDGTTRSGPADPWFGGQLQALRQERAGLDLGLAYWHKVPRASVEKGIGTGKSDDTLLLAASRTDGPWELDLNAGANWLGQPDATARVRQKVLSLAVTRALGGGWNVSLDAFALGSAADQARTVTSILAVTRDVTPGLTLDLGVEAGLTAQAERLGLDAGLVWRIGRFWGS
ncbi:MAG: transporter [Holophaga sp.]|jgi:hypothetical protein